MPSETRQGRFSLLLLQQPDRRETPSDTGGQPEGDLDADDVDDNLDEHGLNPNQVRAVESSDNPLALIWGPPGIVGFLQVSTAYSLTVLQALGKPLWS
jgi:hypothetical protein